MGVFLCVSLVITKVSAGPSLFSASIIAAEVGPPLRKSGRWLHWNHIIHRSVIQEPKPQIRPAFSSIWTATHCSGLCKIISFALKRIPDLSVCPLTLLCFLLYSAHAEWQPASHSKNSVSNVSDVNLYTCWCCYFCLYLDMTHILHCSKVMRSVVLLPDFIYF